MCRYDDGTCVEEWRDVVGYEGYQVSDLGRTKVLEKLVEYSDGRQRTFPEKILKLKTDKSGNVLTRFNGESSVNVRVDRLVAETFVPNPDNKDYVLHVDGDILNCAASNLRWATIEEIARSANDAMSMEENGVTWCGVRGYEDLYQIGTNGAVRSLNKAVRYGNGYRVYPGTAMTPLVDNCGYEFIHLVRNGSVESRRIDIMVADAFLPENCDMTCVVHKDGNILNSRVENLARMTFDEYVAYRRPEFIASVSEPGENWRDIPEFFNRYMVSDYGRVLSLPRFASNAQGVREVEGRILAPKFDELGYKRVILGIGNVSKTVLVHRLVAKAFVANPSNLPVVDHINCDSSDARACNLRWCTQAQNIAFSIEKGRHASRKKPVVRSDGRVYPSQVEAARDLGYNCGDAVRGVLTGKREACKGYSFEYL